MKIERWRQQQRQRRGDESHAKAEAEQELAASGTALSAACWLVMGHKG